jgi:hypothetical protein
MGERINIITSLIVFLASFHVLMENDFSTFWKVVAFIALIWFGNKIAGSIIKNKNKQEV